MTTACLYARYSSHSQTERSIEGQIQDAESYAKQNGIKIVKIYEEPHRSGTHADTRPVFQQMIKDAEHHPWDVVLVWKLDRFARNRYDAAMYRAKLRKNNIRILSIMEHITDSPEGIILESMLEGMAEYYSANLSENIRRGQRIARQNGEWHGGDAPLGYRVENKKLVPDEKTAPVVKRIFEDYTNGVQPAEIIRRLNSLGIKTSRNKAFTYSILGNILKCERYIGVTRYQGEIVNTEGAALISEELFNKAQEVSKNKKRNSASAGSYTDFILTDKAFCGCCGNKLIGNSGTSHTGKIYSYYSCTKNKHKRTCPKRNEPKSTLEEFVVRRTLEAISDEDTIKLIAKKVVECYDSEFNTNKIAELEKEIERHNRELDKLTDKLLNTSVQRTIDRINEMMESESAILDELEDELQGQKQANAVHRLTEEDVKAFIFGFIQGDANDPTFCKYLVDTFVNSIYVYDDEDDPDDGKIVINYNVRPSETVTWEQTTSMLEGFARTTSKWSRWELVRTFYKYTVFTLIYKRK